MLKYFPFCLLLLISCKPQYKECRCQFNDPKLKAYNELLNEIVQNHLYNFYLGEDEGRLFKAYAKNPEDSIKIDRETIILQNRLFNDTSRFCTLYLDSAFRSGVYMRPGWQSRRLLSGFSNDPDIILDNLNTVENSYRY